MPYNQLFDTKYYYHPTYIGYGVTSYVYKGYFISTNNEKIFVAIKQIAMEKISMKIANYINNEIQILSELNHPYIVKMYDHFVRTDDNGDIFTYIIFEWLSKNELELLIKKDHLRWNDDDILYLFAELMKGIKYLHDNGIIHRDIKPTNIVLVPNDNSKYKNIGLKLIDFGFSIKSDTNLQNTVCGSPMYMAPEMPLGKAYDKKVDIWSLGVVLHQMKYGIVPFSSCKTMYDLLCMWEKNEYVLGKIDDKEVDKKNVAYILIEKMLNHNIEQRVDADDIIKYINDYFESKIVYYSIASESNINEITTVAQSLPPPQFTKLFIDHDHSKFKFDFEQENFINKSLTNSTIPRVGSLEDYFIIINEKPEADATFDMIDDYFDLVTFTSNDSIFNRIPLIDNFSIDKCVAYINDAKNIITDKLRKLGYV